MEDRLAVISLIISNPDSVATVNEKFHLQSSLITVSYTHLTLPTTERV